MLRAFLVMIDAKYINSFKNKLCIFWANEEVEYNWKSGPGSGLN